MSPAECLGLAKHRLLQKTWFTGLVLFIFAVTFPPLDDISEVNLAVHMFEHVLIVLSGFLIAYQFHESRRLLWLGRGSLGVISFIVVSIIFVYWHLPGPWDSSVLNPGIHAAEHASFLLSGLLIGSAFPFFPDSWKISSLLLAFFGHMAYVVFLILPGVHVYPLYPVEQQLQLAWVLLLTGGSFLVAVAYLFFRHPFWLEGSAPPPAKAKKDRIRTKQNNVYLFSSAGLLIVLLGYFVLASLAVSTTGQGSDSRSVYVKIEETPFSWSYSPSNITVVLGINSTVVWVSHSVAYDTVTSDSGLFSSGPIPPGGRFEYTFTLPGVYTYHCIYHPWMSGSVTVVESGR